MRGGETYLRILANKPYSQITFSGKYVGIQIKTILRVFSLNFFFLRPKTQIWTETKLGEEPGGGRKAGGGRGMLLWSAAQWILGIVVSQ